jgi:hypothetical protein
MDHFRSVLGHYILHMIEGVFVDNRWSGVFDTYRRFSAADRRVARPSTEYQYAVECFVIENLVYGGLSTTPACIGKNLPD